MCSGLCVARMKEKQQGTDLGRRVQAEARGVHQQNKYVWKYHNETQYFVCFKNKNKKIKVTVLFCSQIYEDVASIGHNMGLGWGGYFIGVKIGLFFFLEVSLNLAVYLKILKMFISFCPFHHNQQLWKKQAGICFPDFIVSTCRQVIEALSQTLTLELMK